MQSKATELMKRMLLASLRSIFFFVFATVPAFASWLWLQSGPTHDFLRYEFTLHR